MKSKLLGIITIIGLSISFIPPSFGDNEFCNIQENLRIQEELIKDNIVLIEFLKVFPNAKLVKATGINESNPGQTSITWIAKVYSLDILIWGFDKNSPSDCFVPGGYRLNAPHLPEMIGLDYHKDPQIVLDQINELEPKYIKGGPLESEPNCGPNTFLNDIGVCQVMDFENCDDPYDYDCGKPSGSTLASDDIIGHLFLYYPLTIPLILVPLLIIYIIKTMKKKND